MNAEKISREEIQRVLSFHCSPPNLRHAGEIGVRQWAARLDPDK